MKADMTKTGSPPTSAPDGRKMARDDRLAKALRANLKRRKDATREGPSGGEQPAARAANDAEETQASED